MSKITEELLNTKTLNLLAEMYETIAQIGDAEARDAACDNLDAIADCLGVKDEFFAKIGL